MNIFYDNMKKFAIVLLGFLLFCQSNLLSNEFGLNDGELDWIDYDKSYVKIETKEDGVTKVSFADLVAIMPELEGINADFVQLYHFGKPYTRYIIDDDGIIDYNSTLVFYGRRPYGDTTYLDFYAEYEPFFLFVDDKIQPRKFILADDGTQPLQSEKAKFRLHIEQEKIYSYGSNFHRYDLGSVSYLSIDIDSRTIMGEGWMWALLTPSPQRPLVSFTTQLLLHPTGYANDEFKIHAHYRTIQDSILNFQSVPTLTYYDLRLNVNSVFKDRDSITGYKSGELIAEIEGNQIPFGINEMTLESHQVYNTTNSPVGLNFFLLEGVLKTIAHAGKSEFFVSEPTSIKVSGFHGNEIIALDTTNHTIRFGKNQKSGFVYGGGGIFNKSTTLMLNDNSVYRTQNGLHILYRKPGDSVANYLYDVALSSSINNSISQFPIGTEIVAIINNPGSIQGSFDEFIKLGSKSINNINTGNIWTFATVKGSSNSVWESVQAQLAGFSGFMESGTGIRFQADFNINTDKPVNILSRDTKSVHKPKLRKIHFKNLANTDKKANAIYLTHETFTQEVERLAEFRRKTQGFVIEIVDVYDIYNEFNFGKQSAYAIKKFLKYAYDNWQSPKIRYLMIAGDATWDVRKNYNGAVSEMFVPAWGNPVSDWWYGCLDGEDDFVPEILVGRVTANSLQQMRDYVDKVIVYDTLPPNRWMKNVLFLTGGLNVNERRQFYNEIWNRYEDPIMSSGFCGNISFVRKLDDSPSSAFQGGEIRNEINSGAMWTIYIGHASAEVFDMDGWAASNLNNKDRYGFLTTVSCNTGAFAEPALLMSRNEQYLMQKDKGFVGVFGSTTVGFVGEHNFISGSMLELLADENKRERNIAEILNYGKSRMAHVGFQLMTLYQFSLLGDPLIRVRLGADPDIYINKSDILIDNEISPNISDSQESVSITGKMNNYGTKVFGSIPVALIRTYADQIDTFNLSFNDLCLSQNFTFELPVKSMPGTHSITIIADPELIVNDMDRSNNQISFNLEVFGNQLLHVEPQAFWDVNSESPKFRLIEPLIGNFDYEFQLLRVDNNEIVDFASTVAQTDVINIFETHIDYQPTVNLSNGVLYFLKSKRIDANNPEIEYSVLPFVATDKSIDSRASWTLPFSDKLNFDELENLAVKNDQMSFKDSLIPVKIISVKGVTDTSGIRVVEPYILMQVGDKVTADGPYDIGISVTVINSRTFPESIVHRRFDTWGLNVNEVNWRTDSTSFRLVEFLRDSVSDDDYVMIGSCRSSFRLPVYFKVYETNPGYGSIDSLLAEFKKLGSLIGDTLDINPGNMGQNISFAMMGWRGATIGTVPEGINMDGDSVVVDGFITKLERSGLMTSTRIGPAKKWNFISIAGNLEFTTAKMKIRIYGIDKNNSPNLLLTSDAINQIDISSIDAELYSYIYFDVEFEAQDIPLNNYLSSSKTHLTSILVNYLPSPEIAIIQTETKTLQDNYILGDIAELQLSIQNLSYRATAEDFVSEIIVRKAGNESINYDYKIESINPNQQFKSNLLIDTKDLDSTNTIFINLDNQRKLNEQFVFNNSSTTSLKIGPDLEKPHINLKFDGIDFVDGSYISRQPFVEVYLYDNSKLQFEESSLISVRINGFLHPFQRTLWHEYETVNDGTDLKAIFRFIPDTLQFADASIIVYFSDMAGNADTVEYSAKVMLQNANIGVPRVIPNPASENSVIEFMYAAPMGGAMGKIAVFDIHGRNVRNIEQTLSVGLNKVPFNLRDNLGNILPTGVYFFVVNAEGDYYHDPQRGKIVIVR